MIVNTVGVDGNKYCDERRCETGTEKGHDVLTFASTTRQNMYYG